MKVDLKQLEAIEAKKVEKSLLEEIQEKVVGGVKIFKGPSLSDWFDDYGECILANAEAKRQAEFKKAGLDEFGRSPEQALLSKERAKLLAKKAALFAEIKEVDLEIAKLRLEEKQEASDEKEVILKKKGKK